MSIEFSSNPSFPNSEKNNSIFPYHGSFSDPNIRVPGFREEGVRANATGDSFSSTLFPFEDFPLFLSGKFGLSGTELSLRYPGPQRVSQILHTPTALYDGLRAEAVLKPNQASIGGSYPWRPTTIERGDVTTVTAGGNIELMRDPSLRLDALSIQHSILRFLDPETSVPERKKWLEQFGVHIPESDLAEGEILRQAMLSFSLGNLWIFDKKDGDTDGLFLKMGMTIRGDQVIVNESGTKLLLGGTVGIGGDVFRSVETFLPNAILSSSVEMGSFDLGAKGVFGVDSLLRMTAGYTIPRDNGGGHRASASAGIDTNIGSFAGAKYDRTGATGKGVGIGFELGTHGVRLILSRSNLLAGTPSVSRNFGTSGVRAEITYAPGLHVIDASGSIYGLQGTIFQFFGRTPELESALSRILPLLEQLSKSGRQVIVQEDFLKMLATPEQLRNFVAFLEKNSSLFGSRDFPFENIIFSKKNESGLPMESDFRRSQLRVGLTGLVKSDVRSYISSPLDTPSGETRIETDQTRKYGIRVHLTNPTDSSVSEGIDRWIELAVSRGEIEHLRGKHILITRESLEKREQFIFDHVTASGQYQEITIPIVVIMEIGQKYKTPIVSSDLQKNADIRSWFSRFVDARDMQLVPQIRVVPDSDMSLRDPHADIPTQKRYSTENGILVVSQSYMNELESTFRDADMKNLSWFERLQRRSIEQMILASRVREVEYIEKYSEVLQSSREAQIALSQDIAGTTLYEVVPTQKEGMKQYFSVRETASKSDIGIFSCELDANGKISLEIDHEVYLFRTIDDPESKRLFERFPWLRIHLFGTTGVNPLAGKKVYLPGIIASLFSSRENSKN